MQTFPNLLVLTGVTRASEFRRWALWLAVSVDRSWHTRSMSGGPTWVSAGSLSPCLVARAGVEGARAPAARGWKGGTPLEPEGLGLQGNVEGKAEAAWPHGLTPR